jgi:Outer membrane protein beta-barrel domain
MKLHAVLIAGGLLLGGATPIWAQAAQPRSPVSRVDLTGTIGSLSVDKSELTEYNNWFSSWSGGGSVGWYWTDHLKTEVELAASNRIDRDAYTYEQVGNLQISRESEYQFSTRRVAVGQHYQFFRNAVFHPFVAAGIDFNWERIAQEDGPERVFDITGRQNSIGEPAVRRPERTELHTRPFATLGFKAYMTPRAFFRTDLKFVIDGGVEEALFRFGFGVDF